MKTITLRFFSNPKSLWLPLLAFSILALASSCRSTRRLKKDEALLVGTGIQIDNPKVSKDEMYSYLRLKPNRRMFDVRMDISGRDKYLSRGIPVYLFLYNLPNKEHVEQHRASRDRRIAVRRARHNKPAREKKPSVFGDIFLNIGEEPSIIDTSAIGKSARQLELYLNNKGYFGSTVTDTIIYLKHNPKKALVYYRVKTTEPFHIRNISWDIADTSAVFRSYILSNPEAIKIKPGDIYDVDHFQEERDRITRNLQNNGYYRFSKDYIRYSVDTTAGKKLLDVKVRVDRQKTMTGENDTAYILRNHQRFTYQNVYIVTNYSRKRDDTTAVQTDTVRYDGTTVLYHNFLRYKPSVLSSRLKMRPDSLYRIEQLETAYRELTALKNFKLVSIGAREAPYPYRDKLNCYVLLQPVFRQSFSNQLEGTNTSGNLGIAGSFTYSNYNLFRGAEILSFTIKGGTEAQQSLTQVDNQSAEQLTFNTVEVGPELSLFFPRAFFPYSIFRLKRAEVKKTTLSSAFNFQRRAEYERSAGNLTYGYTFLYRNRKNAATTTWNLSIGDINVIKAKLSESFEIFLNTNNDVLLQNRFRDHLTINDARVSMLFSTQDVRKNKNVVLVRTDVESAGNILRLVYENSSKIPDGNGSYRIAGIPFAQYLRSYLDVRYYRSLTNQKFVTRVAVGLAQWQQNFRQIPIEKSFFGGGANGIRAWNARTLGPGNYSVPQDEKSIQFGDYQFEVNLELRSKLFSKTVEGAVFVDAGNIWLHNNKDSVQNEGEFVLKNALNELAVGPGLGLRIDLQFFLLRLDVATPIRDPARAEGDRFHFYTGHEFWQRTNLNFGIGYPF